jgi:hypothetical protein
VVFDLPETAEAKERKRAKSRARRKKRREAANRNQDKENREDKDDENGGEMSANVAGKQRADQSSRQGPPQGTGASGGRSSEKSYSTGKSATMANTPDVRHGLGKEMAKSIGKGGSSAKARITAQSPITHTSAQKAPVDKGSTGTSQPGKKVSGTAPDTIRRSTASDHGTGNGPVPSSGGERLGKSSPRKVDDGLVPHSTVGRLGKSSPRKVDDGLVSRSTVGRLPRSSSNKSTIGSVPVLGGGRPNKLPLSSAGAGATGSPLKPKPTKIIRKDMSIRSVGRDRK